MTPPTIGYSDHFLLTAGFSATSPGPYYLPSNPHFTTESFLTAGASDQPLRISVTQSLPFPAIIHLPFTLPLHPPSACATST